MRLRRGAARTKCLVAMAALQLCSADNRSAGICSDETRALIEAHTVQPVRARSWPAAPLPLELHIIALYTSSTCALLRCWIRRMKAVIESDLRANYSVHLGWLASNHMHGREEGGTGAAFRSDGWLQATRAKVDFLNSVLKARRRLPTDRHVYLAADLDAIPLAAPAATPYSQLAEWLLGRATASLTEAADLPEIAFMSEPRESAGACGLGAYVANSGFMFMRNTASVRRFWLHVWVTKQVNHKLDDQTVVNSVLRRLNRTKPDLRWGLLPRRVVSASLHELDFARQQNHGQSSPGQLQRLGSVAFHAAGVSGEAKLWRIHGALHKASASNGSRLADGVPMLTDSARGALDSTGIGPHLGERSSEVSRTRPEPAMRGTAGRDRTLQVARYNDDDNCDPRSKVERIITIPASWLRGGPPQWQLNAPAVITCGGSGAQAALSPFSGAGRHELFCMRGSSQPRSWASG